MDVRMAKQPVEGFNINYDLKELVDRFGRLLKQLGANNRKGTVRYTLEVEFAYALHELKCCPNYQQWKALEGLSQVVLKLTEHLKKLNPAGDDHRASST